MMLGVGPQGFEMLSLNPLVALATTSLIFAVACGIGEELGWRSVLQPALEARLGPVRGTLAVGLIWAYWHLPANLAGYNDRLHPLLSALFIFPTVVVGLAFAFAWLFRASRGGAWVPALAHAAYNAISSGFVVRAHGWAAENAPSVAVALLLCALFGRLLARHPNRAAPVLPPQGLAPRPSA